MWNGSCYEIGKKLIEDIFYLVTGHKINSFTFSYCPINNSKIYNHPSIWIIVAAQYLKNKYLT